MRNYLNNGFNFTYFPQYKLEKFSGKTSIKKFHFPLHFFNLNCIFALQKNIDNLQPILM